MHVIRLLKAQEDNQILEGHSQMVATSKKELIPMKYFFLSGSQLLYKIRKNLGDFIPA